MQQRTHSVVLLIALLLVALFPTRAQAVCATVKIQIVQDVTFERQAFDARLQVKNETSEDITDLLVTLTFVDTTGQDRSTLFYVSLTSYEGMSGPPDGSGDVPAGSSADIHWLLIPSPGAGGEEAAGVRYLVGAELSFYHDGELKSEQMDPDAITVLPMPELYLDYFLTQHVIGDDPYTLDTEPPVPFSLGVRVLNQGAGTAANLQIESGQPEIVDNDLGLLIAFEIIASEVNGLPGSTALNVDFGDLEPATAGVARWSMIATLSGEFIDFNASWVHDDALGGELTSLIAGVETHFLVHEVQVDLLDRDQRIDFLAWSGSNDLWVYESDARDEPVDEASGQTIGVPTSTNPVTQVNCTTLATEQVPFYYVGLADPGNGQFRVSSVRRSDGTELLPENYWVTGRYDLDTHDTTYTLGIFDAFKPGVPCQYTVTYNIAAGPDSEPPTSHVDVLEPSAGSGPVCVTSDTAFVFAAEDQQSTVTGIFSQVDGDPQAASSFPAAVNPFRFSSIIGIEEGPHNLYFYAQDASGNEEPVHTLGVTLDDTPPVFSSGPIAMPSSFAPTAPSGSTSTEISFAVTDVCGPVDIVLEVSPGTSFNAANVVAQVTSRVDPGVSSSIVWQGRNSADAVLPAGTYTLRLTATDALGHTAVSGSSSVTIIDPLNSTALSTASYANQIAADIEGQTIVWQDDRSGDWDIYAFTNGVGESLLSAAAPIETNQTAPAIAGGRAVWVDDRSGTPTVYVFDMGTQEEQSIPLPGIHGAPDINGSTVVFEAFVNNQWDIYAYDAGTGQITQLTTHERNQRNPTISGGWVAYEDDRHGATTDIYFYNLSTHTESRLTSSSGNESQPVARGNTLLWLDDTADTADVWSYDLSTGERRRLTYGAGEQSEAFTDGVGFVYLNDGKELARGVVAPGVSRPLTADGAARMQPVLEGSLLAWSERSGDYYQLRFTTASFAALEYDLLPGLNLIALPGEITSSRPMAAQLLNDWSMAYGVYQLGQYGSDGLLKRVLLGQQGIEGNDFALATDRALLAWASYRVTIGVSQLARSAEAILPQGFTALGVASVPYGYGARELIDDLGAGNVLWVRRFDSRTGRFEVMAIDAGAEVGDAFVLSQGDGLFVHTVAPANGWRP